jgi:divalent metal cation (Fe/Co/Zn/Cd) transporter
MADLYFWGTLILSTVTTFGLYMILSGVDSPWFAFAEHAFVGTAIGLSVVLSTDYLLRTVFPRILANPAGEWPTIVSVILGLMMILRVNRGTVIYARLPITIATAAGIAVSVRGTIFTGIINQIKATILPIFGLETLYDLFVNISVVLGVIFVFTYYFYTVEIKGPLKQANQIGRWVLYLAFGVLFAQTYMGRLGLLLGRLQLFVTPTSPNLIVTVIIVGLMIITTWLLHKNYPELLEKLTP